eukprot:6491014-Amphidinium_carterae.2
MRLVAHVVSRRGNALRLKHCSSGVSSHWGSVLHNPAVRWTLRSDSMTAVHMVVHMSSRGGGPALITRELALEFRRLSWHPRAVQHIPGEINEAPDYLSCLQFFSYDKPLPPALRNDY